MISAFESWNNYCARLPWKHGCLDESSYLAFLRAASLGIPPTFARSKVIARLRRAHPPQLREDKIASQLVRAYTYVNGKAAACARGLSKAKVRRSRKAGRAIDFEVVDYLVTNRPGIGETLTQAPGGRTEEIIDLLFPGNPLLCVGEAKNRFTTRTREELRGGLERLQFIVPSPMRSRTGRTLAGRLSEHCLDNTGLRRFLVIEFDLKEFDSQGLATKWTPWIQKWRSEGKSVLDASWSLLFNLTAGARGHPLTLIVYSGNKSLHGWFYCAGEHQGRLHAFMLRAVRLGADPQTWFKSQFVRMPDGRRADGRRQTVLYFNPETV